MLSRINEGLGLIIINSGLLAFCSLHKIYFMLRTENPEHPRKVYQPFFPLVQILLLKINHLIN